MLDIYSSAFKRSSKFDYKVSKESLFAGRMVKLFWLSCKNAG